MEFIRYTAKTKKTFTKKWKTCLIVFLIVITSGNSAENKANNTRAEYYVKSKRCVKKCKSIS